MAARLWSIGSLLVLVGIAAYLLGWDTLLWLPHLAMDLFHEQPWTAGLILLGLALMLVARVIGGRRG